MDDLREFHHASDWDLGFLREQLDLIEKQHFEALGQVEESPDPDGVGLYEWCEFIAGLAFVTSQTGIHRVLAHFPTIGGKAKALDVGPYHCTGGSWVAIINAAANLWKHAAEWKASEANPMRDRTLKTLRGVGVTQADDYPLTCALDALKDQSVPDIGFLADILTIWRDELRRDGA